MAEVVVKRYGDAFYYACADNLDKFIPELKQVCDVFDDDLVEFLYNPIIDYEKKRVMITKDLSGYSQQVLNLILLLIKNRHIQYLSDIYAYINSRYIEDKKIKVVTVISARPLSEKITGVLKGKLSNIWQGAVRIRNEVDPSIIGGIQLKTNDLILDLSISNRLNNLKKSLLNAKVGG